MLAAAGLLFGLGATAAYTVETIAGNQGGGIPTSGPARSGSGFGFGGPSGPGEQQASDNTELKNMLTHDDNRWAAATVGSHTAGSLELSTGTSIMSIGGFDGGDNSPTLEQFQANVAGDRSTTSSPVTTPVPAASSRSGCGSTSPRRTSAAPRSTTCPAKNDTAEPDPQAVPTPYHVYRSTAVTGEGSTAVGNAAFVGRVGALAVALGIGSWLASTPCVATAQPSNTSAASSDTASKPKPKPKPKPVAVGGTRRTSPAQVAGARSAKVAKPQQLSIIRPLATAHVPPDRAVATALHSLVGTGGTPPQLTMLWSMLAYAGNELHRITGMGKASAVTVTATPSTGPNLLTNPGAELGDAAGYGNSTVSVPGWTATGTPTVVQYGELRNAWPVGLSFAWPNLPAIVSFPGVHAAPPGGGNQFFGGGDVATSALSQTVDLSASMAEIDGGAVPFNLSGYLGGYLLDPSFATVKVTFLDQNQLYLGSSTIGPVTNLDRLGQTGLRQRTTIGTIPVGTRSAVVTLTMHDLNPVVIGFTARYNNAYADNLSFSIGTAQTAPPDPAPPLSNVGQLDHVFLVYMENKGRNDIVGSPNAPFLNSLINAYGFADNYYAVTHPSMPNYYAIVGGQVYGKTYNCQSVCIDDPNNLAFNIDAAGKTWAAYAQSMTPGQPLQSGGGYSTEQTPWPAFAGIGDNQTYAAAHMFPLTQMAVDLQSDATTPDFVWFAADEDSNGEGPVDTLAGAGHFLLSQIDPRHQYNVPALDAFLQENVPTIINSETWQTTKSVLIVTFDEDNNNITLGFGNEGNNVVTVVIPSPLAVTDGGMKGGAFVVTDRYDHYSTLRTIEDALGLPTMTNNDKYADPLNGFWT